MSSSSMNLQLSSVYGAGGSFTQMSMNASSGQSFNPMASWGNGNGSFQNNPMLGMMMATGLLPLMMLLSMAAMIKNWFGGQHANRGSGTNAGSSTSGSGYASSGYGSHYGSSASSPYEPGGCGWTQDEYDNNGEHITHTQPYGGFGWASDSSTSGSSGWS